MRKVSEPRHLPYYFEIGEHMLKGGSLLVQGDLLESDIKLLTGRLAKIKPLVAAILERSNDVAVPFTISHGELAALIDYGIVVGSLGPRSRTVLQRAKDLTALRARAAKKSRLNNIDTIVAEESKDGAAAKVVLERVNQRLVALGWASISLRVYYDRRKQLKHIRSKDSQSHRV
jgi:hypothetical protein